LKRISTRALGVVSFAAFAAACSLMHLGDVETPPCKSHRDCASAIRAAGEDPELCLSYLCNAATGFCEPAGSEHCDAEDNDCDGFIDETLSSEPHEFENASELTRETFAYAAGSNGKTYVATTDVDRLEFMRGWVITSDDDRSVSGHILHFDFETENGRLQGCPDQNGATQCNFAQLAFATFTRDLDAGLGALDERLVMAGINTSGCGKGQLRFGLGSGEDPFGAFQGSVDDENPLVFGVPSIDACNDGNPGASFPALAALERRDTAQALAVWLETPIREAESVLEPTPVQALGLFVPESKRDSLDATNAGQPDVLGESTCRSAPAVLADARLDGQQRFVVAFPGYDRDTLGIVVRTVGFDASPDGELDGVLLHIPETGAGPVALARGPTEADGSPSVGLAWRAGCGMSTSVGFRTISFRTDGGTSVSAPVHLATGPIVRGPELVYAEHGFATTDPQSGWFVLWEENLAGKPRLQLARVAARQLKHLETRTLGLGVPATWFPQLEVGARLGWGGLEDGEDAPEAVVVSSIGCAESRVETL
jgi:hypothetical protein